MDEYRRIHFPHLKTGNGILVFDTACKSKFMAVMKMYPHTSVPQVVLDSVFNDFANIILFSKGKDNTFVRSEPYE